jgi:hypothetical protein
MAHLWEPGEALGKAGELVAVLGRLGKNNRFQKKAMFKKPFGCSRRGRELTEVPPRSVWPQLKRPSM